MFVLKEKTYINPSEKILDYLIGTFLLVLFVLPFIFIQQIGNFVSQILLKNSRDALGLAALLTLFTLALPLVGGIVTFLISRKRKLIFKGFVLAIPVLLIIWLAISGTQKDQEISKLHYQIDDLKKQQNTQSNEKAVDTSGWKTYTDKNGYQISYPSDFYYQDVKQVLVDARESATKAGGAGGGPTPDSRIMFSTDSSDFATKDRKNTDYLFYIDTYGSMGGGDFLGIPTDNSFSTRNIGGISWTTRTYTGGLLAMNVSKNNILYYIYIPGKTTQDPEQMKQVNEMLNSFKFTNTNTNDQIFAEVSSKFGFNRDQVSSFKIHKNRDRVVYRGTAARNSVWGTHFAYKDGDTWKEVPGDSGLSVMGCSSLSDVPEKYRTGCEGDTSSGGQNLYINDQNQFINYLPSDMTSYIGQ